MLLRNPISWLPHRKQWPEASIAGQKSIDSNEGGWVCTKRISNTICEAGACEWNLCNYDRHGTSSSNSPWTGTMVGYRHTQDEWNKKVRTLMLNKHWIRALVGLIASHCPLQNLLDMMRISNENTMPRFCIEKDEWASQMTLECLVGVQPLMSY